MAVTEFPAVNNDVVVELYMGTWVDVTGDISYRDGGISISRGSSPDSTGFQTPSRASMTIMNRAGNYSPLNPLGTWYKLLGQNTPCRICLRLVQDLFARTASNSWGTAPLGQTYTLTGASSAFAVASGVATQTFGTAGAHVAATVSAPDLAGQEASATWSLAVGSVTGGTIEPCNLMIRWQASNSYYLARVQIATSGAISLGIRTIAPTGEAELVVPVATGLTYVSGTQYTVRFQASGDALRAKIWRTADPEPYEWLVTGFDALFTHGRAGIRSGFGSGNSNGSVVFSYRDFQVRSYRMVGEVSEWPSTWDTSGKDIKTRITVNGPIRRMGQGEPVENSLLRRVIPGLPGMVAYWPLEDEKQSSTFASVLPGGYPMATVIGAPSFASYTDLLSSKPLVTSNKARWGGFIPPHTFTGNYMVRWVEFIPAAGEATGDTVVNFWTDGTSRLWEVRYLPGGGGLFNVRAWNDVGGIVYDSASLGFAMDGRKCMVSLQLTNNAGNVDWLLAMLDVGASAGVTFTGTAPGVTMGAGAQVNVNAAAGNLQSLSIGHVHVRNVITSIFDFSQQLNAYLGETALSRATRLAVEENVVLDREDGPLNTQPMGGQPATKNTLGLLQECVDAERGLIYESRYVSGLFWVSIDRLYRRPATITLDYSLGQLNGPFTPVFDDLLLRNRVQLSRQAGASVTVQQTTGPLQVSKPSEGGVGLYATSPTVNVGADSQLLDIATWMLHVGTAVADRYPSVTLNRANAHIVAAGLGNAVLDLDVGHRMTIIHPKAGQAPGPVELLVRQYQEMLRQDWHEIEVNAVPASPYEVVQYDSGTRWSSNKTTTTADPGTGGTSLAITVTDATPWTTDAADWPLNIIVNGEVMTVTAISAAAGAAQTFTVTRAVNGISRAHPVGSDVTLEVPFVWALGG